MSQRIALGLRRLTLMAAGILIALACFAVPATVSAGVPGDDAVLLDPFDPVPQIGFRHGECDDPCGYHRCHRGCYRRERGCERDCRDARWYEQEALGRYEHQADTYDMLLAIYGDQLRWWQWRYRDGGHGAWHDGEWRDGVWHEGHGGDEHVVHEEERHDGHDGDHDGDHRDGDRHDGDSYHDGDHHDGHDGDHHDGDHDGHDGYDHHDGDHAGDHHDGDGNRDHDGHDGDHHDEHDGDHRHDGQWQDGDGNWHDDRP
jgi:hypothetical protein